MSPPGSPSPTKALPTYRLLLLTLAMAGIQASYAAQINLGTKHLLTLGLPLRLASLAWLAGPLSGLIVQPLVGHLSDMCTHPLGRRRPFLILGSLMTAASLLFFSHARQLAGPLRARALRVALAGFFALDAGIQAVQGPLRALVTDVSAGGQLSRANCYLGLFAGAGNLVGGVLAGGALQNVARGASGDDVEVRLVFGVTACVMLTCVLTCAVATPEVGASRARAAAPLTRRLLAELRGAPRVFWCVFAVQLCTWSGFFTVFVYLNAWIGRNVYGGDGHGAIGSVLRDRFEMGVRLGGRCNAVMAVVTVVYSLALPRIIERVGIGRVYALSQLVEGVCLMGAFWIRGQGEPSGWVMTAVMVNVALFGVVWATTMSVPWTLIGAALERDERYCRRLGFFTTIFNASQSFPQLIVALAAPVIFRVWGDDDASVVMFAGGVVALLGAVLVVVLRVDAQLGNKLKDKPILDSAQV